MSQLPGLQVMRGAIDCFGVTTAGVIIAMVVSPLVVVAIAPVAVLFEMVRRRYIASARELRRLEALSLSPVLSSFTETLQVGAAGTAFRLVALCLHFALPCACCHALHSLQQCVSAQAHQLVGAAGLMMLMFMLIHLKYVQTADLAVSMHYACSQPGGLPTTSCR